MRGGRDSVRQIDRQIDRHIEKEKERLLIVSIYSM